MASALGGGVLGGGAIYLAKERRNRELMNTIEKIQDRLIILDGLVHRHIQDSKYKQEIQRHINMILIQSSSVDRFRRKTN